MLCWVTVTVDTTPDPGSTLAQRVAAAMDPAAPMAARQIIGQLAATAPAAAADVGTLVSITFDPAAFTTGSAAPTPPPRSPGSPPRRAGPVWR